MEHQNIASFPPWLFWNGGPLVNKAVYHIKKRESDFEVLLFSPIITQTKEVKNQIDSIYSQGIWDDYKKITNPYEYIFLSLSRRMCRSVATRTPLSRSYFKMLELWVGAELTKEIDILVKRDGGLISTHAAEGPGGFIEALHNLYENNVKYSQGMTLRSTSRTIPGWRKTTLFLNRHPTIHISYGADGTGDLLNIDNLDYFVSNLKEKSHVYTADGGFDFSSDFNAQEETILPLLTAEFYLGLKSIQRGGVFIVKIFDTTLRPTIELLWIVTRSFREWSIIKPRTSRGGNAERYLVCKGFIGLEESTEKFFRAAIRMNGELIQSYLTTKPELGFLQKLLSIQEAISVQEIEIIQKTLHLIQNPNTDEIRSYIEQNVDRSIQWCKDHKEEINKNWLDEEWKLKTIKEEIKEVTEPASEKLKVTGWRGVCEDSPNEIIEPGQPRQMPHAAKFARNRPQNQHFEKNTKRTSRKSSINEPDEDGWQKV
jgi:hypothetical protein